MQSLDVFFPPKCDNPNLLYDNTNLLHENTILLCDNRNLLCDNTNLLCDNTISSVWDESSLGKRQFVFLEICEAISAKPGHFNLCRPLVDGYFIVKWHRYIYSQLVCHFKRFYCYNFIIWISQILLNSSISTMFVVFKQSSFLVCSLLIIHGQTYVSLCLRF